MKESREIDFKQEYSKYIIVNNNRAVIDFNNKSININLDENIIYDLWKNSNNGVLIYRKWNDENYSFNVDMKMDSIIGGSSHCGIVLILENENRLLFGSLGKLNIAIHELSEDPNYELFIKNCPFEDIINLKIIFHENKCSFFGNEEILYRMKLKSKIKYYGIFAKTWQNCRCEVSFKINEREGAN